MLPTLQEVFANDPAANGTEETVFQISAFQGIWYTTNANYSWSAMPGEETGWDDFFAELNFFYEFPEGPRKDITFRTEFIMPDGTLVPWQESQAQHPYYQKFYIDTESPELVNNFTSSVPESMIRYAHVLTIYAEAQARATGSPDELAMKVLMLFVEEQAWSHLAACQDLSLQQL